MQNVGLVEQLYNIASKAEDIVSKRVLIVEDDPELVRFLEPTLESLGLELVHEASGEKGLKRALEETYHLIMLDLMLPDMEGSQICKSIRAENTHTPIIVLTGIRDEVTTALLLELGADDYVNKPFREVELKARIRAVMRRSSRDDSTVKSIVAGDLEIDLERRKLKLKGEPVELSAREFDLLALLASSPGRPYSREQLNNDLYGYEVHGYDHSITCHVSRIRAKIEEDPNRPKFLLTARGVGYCFSDEFN